MFDIVTVSYLEELPMLMLQAASIRRFFQAEIGKIIVINNDPDTDKFNAAFSPGIYGTLSDKVQLVQANNLLVPTISRYRDQMILKIFSQRFCISDLVLLLDSKNWLVKNITTSDMIKDNLLLSLPGHVPESWEPGWAESCKLFNIEMSPFIRNHTPFLVRKETLAALERQVDIRRLIGFGCHSEFTLLDAYIHTLGNYFFEREFSVSFWQKNDDLIEQIKFNPLIKFIGIHSRVWPLLDKSQLTMIADHMSKIGICDDKTLIYNLANK